MTDLNCADTGVSVIVPLFRGTEYLGHILEMIRRNSEAAADIRAELLLVNDSPDDVPDFSGIPDTGCPVRIILNEENLGIQRARLKGAEAARGKYLFFLDQDDEIADDCIKKLYRSVNGGEAAVSDWVKEVPGGGGIRRTEMRAEVRRYSLMNFSRAGNVMGPPGHCLIRRDCLPRCYTDRIMAVNGADDYLLWLGMLAEGRTFTHCAGELYVHRQHEGSYSNDTLKMLRSEEEAFRLAADEYGFPGGLRFIHSRSIRYRRMVYSGRASGGDL